MIRRVFDLYRRAYSGLPRGAWILSAVNLVNSAGTMVVFFLALYLTEQLGFSTAEAGRALSIYGAGSLTGAWLGGWLSDRIGSTTVQKLSLVAEGLFLIAMGLTGSLWLLFATLFLFATAAGSLFPANAASMSRVCPPDLHTKGFALNRLANNLGLTIGPAVGGLLALRDYRLLYWVNGLTCLAAAAVFALLWRHPERALRAKERAAREAAEGRIDPAAVGSGVAHEGASSGTAAGPVNRRPGSPWRDVPFLLFMPIVLIWSTIFIQLFSTLPLYLRSAYGLAEDAIGRLVAVNTILIVIFEMAIMEKVRRVSRTLLINVSFILLGLGFGLMPFGRGFAYAAFTVAVWTFGEILSTPLMAALVASRSGPEARGRYMGLFSFTYSLGFIVAPAVGTAVYGRYGGDSLWYGCAAAGVLLAAMFSLLRRSLDVNHSCNNSIAAPSNGSSGNGEESQTPGGSFERIRSR